MALEHPDKETYYLKKAANASHEAGDEISALHLYEQAQKLAPDDVGIAISIANIQKSRGNFRAALELLMDYAQRFPENEPLRALALRTISQHFQFQIDLARERIEADPKDVAAYSLMARTLVMAGESTAALGILTEGVIENPDSVDLWIQIGALEVGSGRDLRRVHLPRSHSAGFWERPRSKQPGLSPSDHQRSIAERSGARIGSRPAGTPVGT